MKDKSNKKLDIRADVYLLYMGLLVYFSLSLLCMLNILYVIQAVYVDSILRADVTNTRYAVPIIYNVDRVRDGKSFATRRVDAIQKGNVVFSLLASFQAR